MKAFKCEDLRSFTAALFTGTLFDGFLLKEARVTTFCGFSIDGSVSRDWFTDAELEEKRIEDLVPWSMVRPFAFQLIRGKRLPESFRVVFALSPEDTQAFLQREGLKEDPEDVSLCLNLRYESRELSCVSLVSRRTFSADRSAERAWDLEAGTFFRRNGLAFREAE